MTTILTEQQQRAKTRHDSMREALKQCTDLENPLHKWAAIGVHRLTGEQRAYLSRVLKTPTPEQQAELSQYGLWLAEIESIRNAAVEFLIDVRP